jgi:chitodextrinase
MHARKRPINSAVAFAAINPQEHVMGAAPNCRRCCLALLALVSIAVLSGATVASGATSAPKAAPTIGVELNGKTWPQPVSAFLAAARKLGTTTVVTQRDQWSGNRFQQLVRAAAAQKLTLVEPRAVPTTKPAWSTLDRICKVRSASVERCAVVASSGVVAANAAQTSRVRIVVVHLATPASLVTLAKAKPRRARVVAILPRGAAGLSGKWAAAVALSEKEGILLGVAPAQAGAATAVSDFSALVSGNLKKVKTVGGATAPSTPTGFSTSAADAVSITVQWDAGPGSGSPVSGYSLSRGGVEVATTIATSVTLTGLTCATTYHVELVAFDASGDHSGVAGLDAATTACAGGSGGGGSGGGGSGGGVADVLPPSAPTAVSANSVTQTGASLFWVASTDNVAIAGYGMYRNGATIGSTGSTSYAVVGLTCGTTYAFAVDAFDAAGNRSVKTTASVTTQSCGGPADTQAPSAPGGPTAGVKTQTSIAVSWSASTDNVGVTGYGLYRNGTSVGSTASTSSTFSGLACGTSYSLAVDAVDGAGNRSAKATITTSTTACSDTQKPSVPGGLTAGATTQTSIAASWSASTDNVGVTGYGLYRNGAGVGSTASTGSSFSGLTCGTSYTLAVDAVDAAGNRSAKATITASTSACAGDTQAPSVPPGYSIGTVTQTSIPVSWTAATDNVGVTAYGIYMTGVLGTATSSLSYSYTGLTCGTSYSLAVDAVDAAGNRSVKATVIAGTAACSTPPPSGSANLWVDTSGGSCARQASAGAYADASACGSFQAAYSAAQCGDTVGVRAGGYAKQTISSGTKSCSSSTQVSFTSVPGAACSDNTTVAMPAFSISVAYVKLACMNANQSGTTSCADVSGGSGQHTSIIWNSFDNMAIHCAFFDSDHLHVTNSTFGPDNTCQTAQEDLIVFRANSGSINDVLFDHVTFATVTAPPDFQCGVGKHVDSMQGYGISNLVISNSIFYGCPGQCIIFRPFSGGTPGPITIENTIFNQAQDPGQAIDIGSSSSSDGDSCVGPILIQNNTFVNGAALHGGCWNNPSVIFRNNIMSGSTCNFGGSGDVYTNNVFYSGSSCGSGAKACTPAYVGNTSSVTSPGDFHLAATDTCAKGAASQTAGTYPATDTDGQARPQGPVDAGVDEIA